MRQAGEGLGDEEGRERLRHQAGREGFGSRAWKVSLGSMVGRVSAARWGGVGVQGKPVPEPYADMRLHVGRTPPTHPPCCFKQSGAGSCASKLLI